MQGDSMAVEKYNEMSESSNMAGAVNQLSVMANELVINNNDDYQLAAEQAKRVRAMIKTVTDYYEPMRKSTYDAYQSVMAKKKEMLAPLEKADGVITKKLKAYNMEVERLRREREEALRRMAREEEERRLEEAAKAESEGDAIGAEMAMAEAEAMESAAMTVKVSTDKPKAEGVGTVKNWVIKSIDNQTVPVFFNGMEFRPVDSKAVLRYIKATKGTVQIPGVVFEEEVSMRIKL